MSENAPFWYEVRSTLMLRGEGWKAVVESLPDRIKASEARDMLQSADQLSHCNMQGVAFLAGAPVHAIPNADVLSQYLDPDFLTLENIVLQWLYQYLILEGLAETNRDKSLADWHPMFLDMYTKGLHSMVYMAALLCLLEEGGVGAIPVSDFSQTEDAVRARVRRTTENLHPKSQDYGESFRRHGVVGLIPRLWDKVARYTQLKSEERPAYFEPMVDSAHDLLGYSAIAWSLMLEVPAVHQIQKTEVLHG